MSRRNNRAVDSNTSKETKSHQSIFSINVNPLQISTGQTKQENGVRNVCLLDLSYFTSSSFLLAKIFFDLKQLKYNNELPSKLGILNRDSGGDTLVSDSYKREYLHDLTWYEMQQPLIFLNMFNDMFQIEDGIDNKKAVQEEKDVRKRRLMVYQIFRDGLSEQMSRMFEGKYTSKIDIYNENWYTNFMISTTIFGGEANRSFCNFKMYFFLPVDQNGNTYCVMSPVRFYMPASEFKLDGRDLGLNSTWGQL